MSCLARSRLLSSLPRRLFFIAAPTLVFIAIAIGAHARLRRHAVFQPAVPSIQQQSPVSASGHTPRTHLEAEVITLRPTGFEPQAITRHPGPFLMIVDNYSGADSITLNLDFEGVGRVSQAVVPRGISDWSNVLIAVPGTYIVTEAGHPDWVCRLIIR